jgi:circadian clock protein KaiC
MTQPEAGASKGEEEIARVPSHVPGLDAILYGGFLRGGLYMVQGPPGAGKTLLTSQSSTARPLRGAAPSSSPCWAKITAA